MKIGNTFLSHFQSIFTSFNPNLPSHISNLFSKVISNNQNLWLSSILYAYKIIQAFWDINSLKAPGPDGYPLLFYKHFWDIVNSVLIREIQSFFMIGNMNNSWNFNFHFLDTKFFNPITIKTLDLSLCVMSYKIIANILVK